MKEAEMIADIDRLQVDLVGGTIELEFQRYGEVGLLPSELPSFNAATPRAQRLAACRGWVTGAGRFLERRRRRHQLLEVDQVAPGQRPPETPGNTGNSETSKNDSPEHFVNCACCGRRIEGRPRAGFGDQPCCNGICAVRLSMEPEA